MLERHVELGRVGSHGGRSSGVRQLVHLLPGRDAGEHQHTAGPERQGRGEVRPDAVADHHGVAGIAPDGLGGDLEEERGRLADGQRGTPVVASRAATIEPAPGPQAPFRRIDRVAIGGDESGAGPDAVRGRGQAEVGQVRVQPDDDRVRLTGGRQSHRWLLGHPGRGDRGRDHVEAHVA